MKNQFYVEKLFFSFFLLFLNHQCAPTKLNGACDPKSESFVLSALLEFGSTDGSYLCPIFSGLNPLRVDYGTDLLVLRQGEPMSTLNPFVSEPIEHCESVPALPQGVNLNESTCAISGTPSVGMNSAKYLIFAKSQSKQTTIPLMIKSLFFPKFAFVANVGSGLINSYTINAVTGSLGGGGFVGAGGGPESMAISPNQKYLTVANRNTNNLSQFSINQTNGNLTIIETIPCGGNTPINVTYHPNKNLLYISNSTNIVIFSINDATGRLTQIRDIPANSVSSMATDLLGNFLYVIDYGGRQIKLYPIDPETGLIDSNIIQSVPTGINPRSLHINTNGKFLYFINESDNSISSYQLNSNTGFMTTPVFFATPSTGLGVRTIVSDPNGKFLYLTNLASDTLSLYGIDPQSGALSSLSPNSVANVGGPFGIATDTFGKFLYVTNLTAGTVSIFTINQSNGNLTPNGNVGTSTSPAVILTSGSNP